MNKRNLDHGSRINAADEGALERAVGPNIFESLNDGLLSKPVTPCAAACAAAFAVQVDTGQVRDILLHRFVRSPHRITRASSRTGPASRQDPANGFLLVSLRWRWFPRSLGLGPTTRQRHAAEAMP